MELHLNKASSTVFFRNFLIQVYGWMALGLFIAFSVSFGIYFFVMNNPVTYGVIYIGMILSFIFQLILVFIISGRAARMNTFAAGALFVIYTILNGITLGAFTIYYDLGTIAIAFLATFLTFAVMSIAGTLIKRDLSGIGGLAIFGLVGVIIGSVVNFILYFFFPQLATGISWLLTYVGLGIFIILVAYDTRKLKKIAENAEMSGQSVGGIAVVGALELYLDFINIFIRLLSIFGRRR